MGAQTSSARRFLVTRKISIVNTRLKISAEYVTPQRIGGLVAPTNRGSALSPALRVPTALVSHAEHAAYPGNDLRCAEGDRDSKYCAQAPAPAQATCHSHGSQPHDQNDR